MILIRFLIVYAAVPMVVWFGYVATMAQRMYKEDNCGEIEIFEPEEDGDELLEEEEEKK